jgi:TatD DNase family protein
MATNEDNQNSTNNKTMEQCYENYILVDVGANLTNKKYSRDLESVIQRARDSGVQKIMVTGTSVKSSKEALRLTRIYPGTLYSTAGIHPHDAKSYTDESWNELKVVASNPECVAVGECGLDYNRNFSEPSEQRQVFRKHVRQESLLVSVVITFFQIELAIEINKPLFVHERDGHDDLLEILDQYKGRLPPVLIHCFTGTAEQALTYLSRGFYIGLTGYLCKDKSDVGVRKLLVDGSIPLDRLVVETDAPFMYPNTRASKLPLHVKDGLTERCVSRENSYAAKHVYNDSNALFLRINRAAVPFN